YALLSEPKYFVKQRDSVQIPVTNRAISRRQQSFDRCRDALERSAGEQAFESRCRGGLGILQELRNFHTSRDAAQCIWRNAGCGGRQPPRLARAGKYGERRAAH